MTRKFLECGKYESKEYACLGYTQIDIILNGSEDPHCEDEGCLYLTWRKDQNIYVTKQAELQRVLASGYYTRTGDLSADDQYKKEQQLGQESRVG